VSTKGGRRPKSPTSALFAYLYFFKLSITILRKWDLFVHTEDRNLMLFALVPDVDLVSSWLRPRRVRVVRLPLLRPRSAPCHRERSISSVFLDSVVSQSSFSFKEFRLCGLNAYMVWKMQCNVAVKYGGCDRKKWEWQSVKHEVSGLGETADSYFIHASRARYCEQPSQTRHIITHTDRSS